MRYGISDAFTKEGEFAHAEVIDTETRAWVASFAKPEDAEQFCKECEIKNTSKAEIFDLETGEWKAYFANAEDAEAFLNRDEMKTFHEHELQNKFIAIFADGSGASIFVKKGKGYYEPDNEFKVPDKEWFINSSGYKWFIPLPDDFKVWGE